MSEFLEVAARIGGRVAQRALWDGAACTWAVRLRDPADTTGARTLSGAAGGTMYSGTAGIGLFLTELFRLTGDREIGRTAEGAVRHALLQASAGGMRFVYHGGVVGIARAAVRSAAVLGRCELHAAAMELLEPLFRGAAEPVGDDVVGGAAGVIPVLLELAPDTDPAGARAAASRLGERLVERACRAPVGWSWGDARQVTHARHLVGLAHGAAGIGYALLELYHATGDARFRYAGEQAFVYERQFADPAAPDWPDFRHKDLSEYVHRRRMGELRARVRAEGVLPYRPRYMTAWCHGAAGIALTRLRAWKVLGTALYRAEADAALATTTGSLEGAPAPLGNFSLCHGVAGNAEALLQGAVALGRPALRRIAEAAARDGAQRYEERGASWPCGTLGGVADPGLMLGEAGIGYFFLRLHDPGTPSVLLPTAPPPAAAPEARSLAEAEALRSEHLHAFFGRTIELLHATGQRNAILRPLPGGGPRPDVADACEALRARIAAVADAALRARCRDAYRLERRRFALARAVDDFTLPFQWSLAAARGGVPADGSLFHLAPRGRVVRTAWTADDTGAPRRQDAYHLLFRAENAIEVRPLTLLAGLALRSLRGRPRTALQVATHLARQFPGTDVNALAGRVRDQLAAAWRAGYVDTTEDPVHHDGA